MTQPRFCRVAALTLVLLIVAEGATLWLLTRRLARLTRENAAMASDRAALRAAQEEAGRRRLDLNQARQRAREAARAHAAAAAATANGPTRSQRFAQGMIDALDDPEFRAALTALDRIVAGRNAGPFLRSLGLSQSQIDQALDLIAQLMIAKMDGHQASVANGLDSAQRMALIEQTQQDLQAQLQSALGPNAYSAYQQWVAQTPARTIASNLQTVLSYASTPLSNGEVQPLTTAIYQAMSPGAQSNTTGYGALRALTDVPPTPRLAAREIAAAAAIPTPPQLAALAHIGQEQATIRSGGKP